MGEVRLLKI